MAKIFMQRLHQSTKNIQLPDGVQTQTTRFTGQNSPTSMNKLAFNSMQ